MQAQLDSKLIRLNSEADFGSRMDVSLFRNSLLCCYDLLLFHFSVWSFALFSKGIALNCSCFFSLTVSGRRRISLYEFHHHSSSFLFYGLCCLEFTHCLFISPPPPSSLLYFSHKKRTKVRAACLGELISDVNWSSDIMLFCWDLVCSWLYLRTEWFRVHQKSLCIISLKYLCDVDIRS